MLGCILSPDSGVLKIAGLNVTGLTQREASAIRRKHIGYVFQAYNLFSSLTARTNVELGLAVRNLGNEDCTRRAEAALETVGLKKRMLHKPSSMSGGEQQRVAIARAIVGNTSIVLADEPTAALDSQTGENIIQLLHSVAHEAHRAVCVVTHDRRLLEYADQVIWMRDGRITSSSQPDAPVEVQKEMAHAD
jgi:putative ABC transport system ATP-binding protein